MPVFDERFIDNQSEQLIYSEHLVRYKLAARIVAGKKVLDIACGTGYGSAMLAEAGAEVLGADISPETIHSDTEAYAGRNNLSFMLADVENLPTEWTGKFDIVVSLETIEHLKSPDQYLKNLKRVLKPGGLLLLSTPNIKVFGQQNPYHFHEYEEMELKNDLEQYFAQVKILAQRNALASYITADGEGVELSLNKTKNEAEYFIALASDGQLPLSGLAGNTFVINQPAWQNYQANPGIRLVNKVYTLVDKVPGLVKLLKKFTRK
jgi:2-polyprenyl-3-methyl-5-hydroxy-6-metoxy-1,4-benzoquinol methylase